MVVGALAWGSLTVLDPLGPSSSPQEATPGQIAVAPPMPPHTSQDMSRSADAPDESGTTAGDLLIARQLAALPEIRMPAPPRLMAPQPSPAMPVLSVPPRQITHSDPPDGFLSDAPRLAQPHAPFPAQEELASAPPSPPPAATAETAPFAPAVGPATVDVAVAATPVPLDGGRDDGTFPVAPPPPTVSLPPAAGADSDDEDDDERLDRKLVLAAHDLTKIPGGYDPRYLKIAYPMGDVPEGMGVCSDVIVRAYRGIGVDLQELVHQSRLGTGDPNVDHRRVQVLIKFFARHGSSLPISPFPESYKPGDIVAYDVPWGRTSKWHIAIVTDQLSPSLRPMVVHNRGYGAKLEDALFHKRIIAHFRIDARNLMALSKPAQSTATRAIVGKPNRRAVARVTPPRS